MWRKRTFAHHKAWIDEFEDGEFASRHWIAAHILGTDLEQVLRRAIDKTWQMVPAAPRIELTAIGEQYVVPGCERRHDRATAPVQLALWD